MPQYQAPQCLPGITGEPMFDPQRFSNWSKQSATGCIIIHHQHLLASEIGVVAGPLPAQAGSRSSVNQKVAPAQVRSLHQSLPISSTSCLLMDKAKTGATIFTGGGAVGLGKLPEKSLLLFGLRRYRCL